MINWYGVEILTYLLANVVNFFLVLFGTISLAVGVFMWILGYPLIFTVISFILYKMEQKGYIHRDEVSR